MSYTVEWPIDDALRMRIRSIVWRIGDPLMSHFFDQMPDVHKENIRRTVLAMVQRDELRTKDDIDHDWSYPKGEKWSGIPANCDHPDFFSNVQIDRLLPTEPETRMQF